MLPRGEEGVRRRRRRLGVTCTFPFGALCFYSSPDPAGCRQPSSAPLFFWLSSFRSPSATEATGQEPLRPKDRHCVIRRDAHRIHPSQRQPVCERLTVVTWVLRSSFSLSSSARRSPNLERLFSSSSHRA